MGSKPFAFYVYECPVCGSQHYKKAEALECCIKPKEGYSCSKCNMIHKLQQEAKDCCSTLAEVTTPISFRRKRYLVLAIRWKGESKSLNYLLGQGATQHLPGRGIVLCNGEVANIGDWIVRREDGSLQVFDNTAFHHEFEIKP